MTYGSIVSSAWVWLAASFLGAAMGLVVWSLISIDPAVRAALDELHLAMLDALTGVHDAAKQEGASVLRGLATGDVSLSDFDAALLTADERRRREAR